MWNIPEFHPQSAKNNANQINVDDGFQVQPEIGKSSMIDLMAFKANNCRTVSCCVSSICDVRIE